MKIDFERLPAYVGIVGSRAWPDPMDIEDVVFSFVGKFPKETTVVSGGAKGVDQWAHDAAVAHGLAPPLDILVDLERIRYYEQKNLNRRVAFAKAAFDRNGEIVKRVRKYDGIVFAYVNLDSETHGTENTIEWCNQLHVPCVIFQKSEEKGWKSIVNQTLVMNKRWSQLVTI